MFHFFQLILTAVASMPLCAGTPLAQPLRCQQDPAKPTSTDSPGPQPPIVDDASPDFLAIGDNAPAIDVAHWLRGKEVSELNDGRIYLVGFWATWCKYCLAEFQTLSRLQQSFADDGVVIIMISDEKLATVFEFLSKPEWNTAAQFSLAADPDLSTQRDYMEAAALGDIPISFLIGREGVIEWIGHPREVEQPLLAVIDKSWDRETFRPVFEAQIAEARHRFTRMRSMKEAYRNKDWDKLLELFDAAIAAHPDAAGLKLQRFALLISEMNRPEEGYRYGRILVRDFWDDARILNDIAWRVVDHDTEAVRDLDFAMQAAERACRLTDFSDARILDTLARVFYEDGDLESALKYQREAVKHIRDDDPLGDAIRATLKQYEREPIQDRK
ncbi:MAG: redoxin domain-containing protein [Phycisphaerales bacterium]